MAARVPDDDDDLADQAYQIRSKEAVAREEERRNSPEPTGRKRPQIIEEDDDESLHEEAFRDVRAPTVGSHTRRWVDQQATENPDPDGADDAMSDGSNAAFRGLADDQGNMPAPPPPPVNDRVPPAGTLYHDVFASERTQMIHQERGRALDQQAIGMPLDREQILVGRAFKPTENLKDLRRVKQADKHLHVHYVPVRAPYLQKLYEALRRDHEPMDPPRDHCYACNLSLGFEASVDEQLNGQLLENYFTRRDHSGEMNLYKGLGEFFRKEIWTPENDRRKEKHLKHTGSPMTLVEERVLLLAEWTDLGIARHYRDHTTDPKIVQWNFTVDLLQTGNEIFNNGAFLLDINSPKEINVHNDYEAIKAWVMLTQLGMRQTDKVSGMAKKSATSIRKAAKKTELSGTGFGTVGSKVMNLGSLDY